MRVPLPAAITTTFKATVKFPIEVLPFIFSDYQGNPEMGQSSVILATHHPREGGDPQTPSWIPAFAGMTDE
jgi:hypothetical protein